MESLMTRQDLARTTPWEIVVAAYLDAGVDSPNTRRAYQRHLRDAFTLMRRDTLADIRGVDLASLRAQVTDNGLSPLSQGQALAAMRSLLTWARGMGAHGLPSEVIGAALRMPRGKVQRPYSILSEPEIAVLLASAPTMRNRALLATMLGAGLRVSEVVGLDIQDVREDSEGGTVLHVRSGKGRRDRIVPVRPELPTCIRAYLQETGRVLDGEGPLFRSYDHGAAGRERKRLTSRAVGVVVAQCVARAGIQAKHISPHSCRHTFALRALRHGASVVAVSKLMGHAGVNSALAYLDHLNLGELREAIPPLPI